MQKQQRTLAETLEGVKEPVAYGPGNPLWAGPASDEPNGGITFSMLTKFLGCRERFRLLVVDGLGPTETFNHRLEYGNMWHICEETSAGDAQSGSWQLTLKSYAQELCKKYQFQQDEINKWYNVCKVQFPIYMDYWAEHTDTTECVPVSQEESFSTYYTLPSGREVRLRGKRDSVHIIKDGDDRGLWIKENKTKGEIDTVLLPRQLKFDLQTMLYVIALEEEVKKGAHVWNLIYDDNEKKMCYEDYYFKGVLYNVVRRPLSGGEGSIRQHKPSKSNPAGETTEQFYQRLSGIIKDQRDDFGRSTFFMRWHIGVSPEDIAIFKRQTLDALLEQLCEWWDWIKGNPDPFDYEADPSKRPGMKGIHWRHPFGVYNPLSEGSASEYDAWFDNGSEIGLTRASRLFKELA